MGFYGNITNTSKTQFSFDKVYSSRLQMDNSANSDGVMVGRYVLVDYDVLQYNKILDAHKADDNGVVVFGLTWVDQHTEIDEETHEETVIQGHIENRLNSSMEQVVGKDYVRVPGMSINEGIIYNHITPDTWHDEYWQITGATDGDGNLILNPIGVEDTPYGINFNSDKLTYGVARGYDSTAWQKTANGYVMVAELNSVVPSFDITTDRPEMFPIPLHFDPDSTNVFYRLHMPQAWGIRVKANSPFGIPKLNDQGQSTYETISNSSNEKVYPSDEKVIWEKTAYDPLNDAMTTTYMSKGSSIGSWGLNKPSEANSVDGAIYYNKAGFDMEKIAYSDDKKYLGWGENDANGNLTEGDVTDGITFAHTGRSGYSYNSHNHGMQPEIQDDTIELSIMLPSIGDTIARVWDILYGGRGIDVIRESGRRNLDITWEDARGQLLRQGLRLVGDAAATDGYNPAEVETVAGAINSIHDLMGMIITADTHEGLTDPANLSSMSTDRIYFDKTTKRYYRKKKNYTYTEPDNMYTYNVAEVTSETFDPTLYFIDDNGEKVKATAYDSNATYYTRSLADANTYSPISLTAFNPNSYWYEDYIGQAANVLSQKDYVQDTKYISDRTYYTKISSSLIGLEENLVAYARGQFYKQVEQNSSLAFQIALEDSPQFGQVYYRIDESKVQPIVYANDNVTRLYVPNMYYYESEPGIYELDPNPIPVANKPHYMVKDTEEGTEQYSYQIQIEFRRSPNRIEETSYLPGAYWRRVIEPVEEGDPKDPPDGYPGSVRETNNGVLYYRVDGEYIPDAAEGESDYFIRNERLVKVPKTKEIDLEHSIDPNTFIKWTDNAFWVKEYDPNNRESYWYRLLNRYTISYDELQQENLKNIYCFYKWNDPSGNVAMNNAYDLINIARKYGDEQLETPPMTPSPLQVADGRFPNGSLIPRAREYALQKQANFYIGGHYYLRVPNDVNGWNLIFDTTSSGLKPIVEKELQAKGVNLNATAQVDIYTENGWIKEEQIILGYVDVDLVHKEALSSSVIFYEPMKYYRLVNGEYILAVETEPIPNEQYYKRGNDYYVSHDEADVIPQGAEWNNNIAIIPNTISLGLKEDNWELVEMPEFARGVNTIHGALLKIQQTLESGDRNTRDQSTVQGMLNTLHDTLNLFKDFTPKEVGLINNYGQLESGPITTDNWIDVEVDSTINHAGLNIQHHEAHTVLNTTSNSDVNGNGDTIELDTPLVDVKGHVIGKNTETVTLPYGYKTITADNDSNIVTNLTANTATITADNTQDDVIIKGYNKWIKVAATDGDPTASPATENMLEIGHIVSTISDTTVPAIPDNISMAQQGALISGPEQIRFPVDTINFDEAGHITSRVRTNWLMPRGFKEIALPGSEGSSSFDIIAARGTEDTVHFYPDSWIEITHPSGRNMNFSHSAAHDDGANATEINVGAQTPAFGANFNIPTFVFDTKGHLYNHSTTTVTIPLPSLTNGSGNVVTGLSLVGSTGAFTETKANLSSILLTDYTSDVSISSPIISASDSLGSAISKLEKGLKDEADARSLADGNEVTARNGAISDAIAALDMLSAVTAGTGEVIGSIDEADGIVTATLKTLTAGDIPDIELSQVVDTANSTDLPAILASKLDSTVAASTYLTQTDAASTYVTQSNAFTQAAADLLYSPIGALTASTTAGSYQVTDEISGETSEVQVTYSQLFGRIRELEQNKVQLEYEISTLEGRIETLEAYHTTPVEPEPEPEP